MEEYWKSGNEACRPPAGPQHLPGHQLCCGLWLTSWILEEVCLDEKDERLASEEYHLAASYAAGSAPNEVLVHAAAEYERHNHGSNLPRPK